MYPSIPSDTISKFLTFAGVCILIYAFTINPVSVPDIAINSLDSLDREIVDRKKLIKAATDRINSLPDTGRVNNLMYRDINSIIGIYQSEINTIQNQKLKFEGTRGEFIAKKIEAESQRKSRNRWTFIGLITSIIGFIWWRKEEKHKALLLFEETTLKGRLYESCQSCAKHLSFPDLRGTDVDGKTSRLFCKECYTNGQYSNPNLKLEDALGAFKVQLEAQGYTEEEKNGQAKSFKMLVRWHPEKYGRRTESWLKRELTPKRIFDIMLYSILITFLFWDLIYKKILSYFF